MLYCDQSFGHFSSRFGRISVVPLIIITSSCLEEKLDNWLPSYARVLKSETLSLERE